jgi:hypothetical protein
MLPGQPLRQLRLQYYHNTNVTENTVNPDGDNLLSIAKTLGERMRSYHDSFNPRYFDPNTSTLFKQIPIDSLPFLKNLTDPNFFLNTLRSIIPSCVERQTKVIGERLSSQITEYIGDENQITKLFPIDEHVLLHGDIHHAHIFVKQTEKNELEMTGLIDFGDCLVGSAYYELIYMHLSTFRSNKRLLAMFLDSYRWWERFFGAPGNKPRREDMELFLKKSMVACLLHEYRVFRTSEEGYKIDFAKVASFNEMAKMLWDVTDLTLTTPIINTAPKPT